MKRTVLNAPRVMALLTAFWVGVGTALACGFHGDIRGGFSGVYPGSIIVASPIADAREKRLLPEVVPQTIFSLHRALDDLDFFRGALQKSKLTSQVIQRIDFSIVLISSGLWSEFVVEGGRVFAQYHVSGPNTGKPVVITDAAVLRAIATKSLDVAEAVRLGLISVRDDTSGEVNALLITASS